MRRVFKWLGLVFLALLLLGGALLLQTIYFRPLRLDWFYAKIFAQYAYESPELLSGLRILPPALDFYSDKLDDLSVAHEAKMAALTKDGLDALRKYDRRALEGEAARSYDVLDYYLSTQVEGDRFRDYDYFDDQMFGMQIGLPNFMSQQHEVQNRSDAVNFVKRLKAFTPAFAQGLEQLRLRESKGLIPPEFAVAEVRKQVADFVAKPVQEHSLYLTFKDKLDRLPADALTADEKAHFLGDAATALEQNVYPAYRQLGEYLAALAPRAKDNFGVWHLPDGDAYYAWAVRSETTTRMTPDEIHQLGLSEVERVGAEMNDILTAQGITEGTLGQRVQQLAKRADQLYPNTDAGRKAVIERYQAILDEVNAGLGDNFHVRPKLGVEVKPVPAYAQDNAAEAYYEGGSFDGVRPGVFYANLRDTTETPKFAMKTLAYHEGIPGHHFQISVAQELQELPFFRRILGFTAYQEGWALYCERLAWELGFEKDPLDNLGRLRDEMLRSVRLVVDTGIHAKHWTREQAIAYMLEKTGMAEKDVTAEVERYFVHPAQALAYKVGMLKILELRERAKKALGPRFKLAEFHDQVLIHGALPLDLLEQVIDGWIAEKQKS
jgi:uncharacterized protein (DUF885 family)